MRGFQKEKKKYHVFVTADTIRGMMLEVSRHPGLECIIQMPGVRIGNDFYFDSVADSGIYAAYEYGMCEKDHEYADHLSTRISEYYDIPEGALTVSQVHKHPPNYTRFSPGDRPANVSLAKQFGGVVNGLILVNPEFKVKFWYIDEKGRETEASYVVDNAAVKAAMPKKSLKRLKKVIEDKERKYHAGNLGKRSYMEEKDMGKEMYEMTDEEQKDFEALMEERKPYIVLLPEEYRNKRYEGELKGYFIEETKTFHVVSDEFAAVRKDCYVIGEAHRQERNKEPVKEGYVVVSWNEGEVLAKTGSRDATVNIEFYALKKDVFSRNQGILECDQMSDKQAVILGVGSGGSFVALELARAGIGSLILVDDDRFGYQNICRHQCGIHDVGKYKVDALAERIADINPFCKVYVFRNMVQYVDPKAFEKVLWDKSILLCCTDNRHSGYMCNELADKYHIPMIDAGCGPRASTGEIFYYKPDCNMPCYTCTYGEDQGVDYSNQAVRRAFYATEAELEKMHFQPGMSLDIGQTAIFEARLAIDLLMEDEQGYEPRILPYINQCTVLLNYFVDKEVNPYMQIFEDKNAGKRPLIWKTGAAQKNRECSYCAGNK